MESCLKSYGCKKVLDVKHPTLEDGGASFFDGNGWTTATIVVTDAAIGVLGEEHFSIEVSIRYARVGGSAGPGVTDKQWVDGSFQFVSGRFMYFGA